MLFGNLAVCTHGNQIFHSSRCPADLSLHCGNRGLISACVRLIALTEQFICQLRIFLSVCPNGLKYFLCHKVEFPVTNHANIAVAIRVQAVFLPKALAAVIDLVVALIAVNRIAALIGAPLVFSES